MVLKIRSYVDQSKTMLQLLQMLKLIEVKAICGYIYADFAYK